VPRWWPPLETPAPPGGIGGVEPHRKAVETFLKRHELPALVKREVLRKLKTGRKYG
jgi:hypothetical protein